MTGVLTRWLYFRLLGATALCATLAFWVQMPGLIGSHGIAPAASAMEWFAQNASFWQAPTLTWLSSSDAMLHALCAASVALSLLLTFNVAPRPVLVLLWLAWLSLCRVGGPFLQFQWDFLLLETLAWSVLYAPRGLRPGLAADRDPAYWARFVVFFIGFKVSFCSGLVKLWSGDPTWRNLTALTYHHWTQPLPNPLSYVAAQLSVPSQQALCAAMFGLELVLPLLAFGPRQARLVAAGGLGTLQLGLMATGNFAYFNLLSFVLVLPLLDDDALKQLAPKKWKLPTFTPAPAVRTRWRWVGPAAAGYLVVGSAFAFLARGTELRPPPPLAWAIEALHPFNVVNSYGAFATMTRTRPEITVEGTRDGVTWTAYDFKWKPGRLDVAPRQVAPWQPRLDWQMWFAALGSCDHNPWFLSFQRSLLLGTPEVLALLGDNPFPQGPPTQVRSTLSQYRFAPLEAKGQWWTREGNAPFCPPLALDAEGDLVRAGP